MNMSFGDAYYYGGGFGAIVGFYTWASVRMDRLFFSLFRSFCNDGMLVAMTAMGFALLNDDNDMIHQRT